MRKHGRPYVLPADAAGSYLEENLVPVEKQQERPTDGEGSQAECKFAGRSRQPQGKTAENAFGDNGKRNELVCKVNGNRIHADNAEEKRPANKPKHIDDPMEKREHRQRIASDHKNERSAPELFVDRHRHFAEAIGNDQPYHRQRRRCGKHPHDPDAASHSFPGTVDEIASENSEQCGTDCRDETERTLVVGNTGVRKQHAGHEGAVNPAGEVADYGEWTGAEFFDVGEFFWNGHRRCIRRRNEIQKHPIGDRNGERQCEECPAAAEHIQKGARHPGDSDSSQHRAHPQFAGEQSGVNQPEQKKNGCALDALEHRLSGGDAAIALAGVRKRPGNAGKKKEQREYGILKPKPVPFHVGKLHDECGILADPEHHQKFYEHAGQPGYHEHVEAAERIQRFKSF